MFGFWDIFLIGFISIQAVVVSYVFHPKWKAFVITLPFTFTFAYLAVGKPVSASNVLGLVILFIFTQAVRILYTKWKVPIVAAIVLSGIGYCLLGLLTLNIVPLNEMTFWLSACSVFIAAVLLLWILPKREEQGARTQLPVAIKAPLTGMLVTALVLIKGQLGGFVTQFPMVGVFAAYDARKSLWTMGRQIPIVIVTQIPMLVVIHLCQPSLGITVAILLGWVTFLVGLFIMQYSVFFNKASSQKEEVRDAEKIMAMDRI